jgi:hypothetical protein
VREGAARRRLAVNFLRGRRGEARGTVLRREAWATLLLSVGSLTGMRFGGARMGAAQ